MVEGGPVPGARELSEVPAVPVEPVVADPVVPEPVVTDAVVDSVVADLVPDSVVDSVVADPVPDPVVPDAVVTDAVDLVGDGVRGGEVAVVGEPGDAVVVDPVPGRGGPQPLPWWRSTTISVEPVDPGVGDVVVPGGVEDVGTGELPVVVWALSGPGGVPVALPSGVGSGVVSSPVVVAAPVVAAPVAVPDVVTAVRVRLAQVLDRAGDWLSSLPANPLSSFLSGALLLVRRSLVPGVPVIPAVSVSNSWVAEGAPGAQTDAVFTVTLGRAYDTEVTVGYATGAVGQSPWEKLAGLLGGPPADTPAIAGADYSPVSGVLTFAPGQTSQQVSVPVLGDGLTEAPETFGLTVYATVPSNTVPSNTVPSGAPAQAAVAATVPARAAAAAAQASTTTGVALGSGTATILDATPVPGAVSAGSPNPLSGQVTGKAVFTDPAGRALSYSVAGTSAGGASVSINAGNGEFVFTPTRDQRLQAGAKTTDTFVVTVANGVATATQTITVKVDAGALINGSFSAGTPDVVTGAVTGMAGIAATDTLGRAVTYAVPYWATNSNGSRVEINSATGEFTYTPDRSQRQQAGADTTDTFIVTATNGVQTETQTITVAVDPGTPTPGQINLGKPDGVSGSVTGTAGFTDTAGRTLTNYSVTPTATGGGTVSINPKTGEFTYTPTNAQRQAAITTDTTDTFTVTASNGVRTATQTITVTIASGAGQWVTLRNKTDGKCSDCEDPVTPENARRPILMTYGEGFVVGLDSGEVLQWVSGIPQVGDPTGSSHWRTLHDNSWTSPVTMMMPYQEGFVVGLDNGSVQQWTGTGWQELHNDSWQKPITTMLPYGGGFVVGLGTRNNASRGAVEQWTGTGWQELQNDGWGADVRTMIPYRQNGVDGFVVGLSNGAVEQWTGTGWQELHDAGWQKGISTMIPYRQNGVDGFVVGLGGNSRSSGAVEQWTGTGWKELHDDGWQKNVSAMIPYGSGFVLGLGSAGFSVTSRGGVMEYTGDRFVERHDDGWGSEVISALPYGGGYVVGLDNGSVQKWTGQGWQQLLGGTGGNGTDERVDAMIPYGQGFVIATLTGAVRYYTGSRSDVPPT